MEWNALFFSGFFSHKNFGLVLRIPKLRFLRSRTGYDMASGRKIRKRMELDSPFHSIPLRVLVATVYSEVFVVLDHNGYIFVWVTTDDRIHAQASISLVTCLTQCQCEPSVYKHGH